MPLYSLTGDPAPCYQYATVVTSDIGDLKPILLVLTGVAYCQQNTITTTAAVHLICLVTSESVLRHNLTANVVVAVAMRRRPSVTATKRCCVLGNDR